MIPWLLWYNGERPHWGLKLKSFVQFLMEQKPEECKMWWPNTWISANRKMLETLFQGSLDHRLVRKRFQAADIFHRSTLDT